MCVGLSVCLQFLYEFDNFTSLDPNLLYPPLLGIPTRGVIPSGPTGKIASSACYFCRVVVAVHLLLRSVEW